MRRQIDLLRREIKNKRELIHRIGSIIAEMSSKPHPDKAVIAELNEERRRLELELENGRDTLNVLEEEFSAECGPLNPPS